MKYNPFSDYDKHGCLTLPIGLYLSLAYLLKVYLIWIISLTYRQDPSALLSIFYPNKYDFYRQLITALPAFICAIIVCFRRVDMPLLMVKLWHVIRWLVIISAIAQGGYSLLVADPSQYYAIQWHVSDGQWLHRIALLLIVGYCLLSERLKDASQEHPTVNQW